eukprot:SAG31_NODE_19942_length_588_cov_0.652352_1_plen_73_part_01
MGYMPTSRNATAPAMAPAGVAPSIGQLPPRQAHERGAWVRGSCQPGTLAAPRRARASFSVLRYRCYPGLALAR